MVVYNSTDTVIKHTQPKHIDIPYTDISVARYTLEKRRLQIELLNIQQDIIKSQKRVAIVFEGRDAAGKGSSIRRFTENLIPWHYRIVNLGIPTVAEGKRWFKRYEQHLPKPGEIVFFDRSWYNRALIEPTMGYCTKRQYRYFMNNVVEWEYGLIKDDLILVKFYLSVNQQTQMIRFRERIGDPLKFWKFSPNDVQARSKWDRFTNYKEQMFEHTSSEDASWVVVNSNRRREARLTCMLYVVRVLGNGQFVPLAGEFSETKEHSLEVRGVTFTALTDIQYGMLKKLVNDTD